MFDLKRPCRNCPFRKGQGSKFRLRAGRLKEIWDAPAFQCHKSVVYEDDFGGVPGDKPQQCAGLMAIQHREDRPHQLMRIAERIGSLDPTALDPDNEVYATWAETRRAHLKGLEP